MAASFPVSSAARSCSRFTVGSSPYQSSPTSASAIARRIRSEGFVTVSDRRSRGVVIGTWEYIEHAPLHPLVPAALGHGPVGPRVRGDPRAGGARFGGDHHAAPVPAGGGGPGRGHGPPPPAVPAGSASGPMGGGPYCPGGGCY